MTLVCGLVYATVQQNYRQSLNDPQIQMAEDAAAQLDGGAAPDAVVPNTAKVNMAASLAPWLAVYDSSGQPIVSSGYLNNAMPSLPSGVFATSTWKQYAEDRIAMQIPSNETRFTWQPQPDVRQAVVLVAASNGKYVAAGRNMREVEDREQVLTLMVAIGWATTIVASFIAQALTEYLL